MAMRLNPGRPLPIYRYSKCVWSTSLFAASAQSLILWGVALMYPVHELGRSGSAALHLRIFSLA
jgi:hypothetical protein